MNERRYPFTRWSLVSFSALFMLTEAFWVVQRVLHPCQGRCVDDGYLMAIYFTFVAYVFFLLPVALVAALVDLIRNRRKFGTWLSGSRRQTPPGRPDMTAER